MMEWPEAQSAAETTRQASPAGLRAELGSHNLPRHLALFYRENEAQLAATTAFLVEGLQSGHRCVYLLDVNTAGDIKSALRRANIDVEQRINAGDLVIRDAEDVYLESGFDPNKMVSTLETEANASVAEGYDGLWLAGENSWCFHTDQSFDHILDFEADFDAACPDLPVTALCQYDLDRFNGTSAAKALRTHEQIVYRNQLCRNPFYIPPEDYRSTDSSELNAPLMLEQAYSLTNARRDINEREQRLGIVNRVLRHNIRNDLNLVKGTLELLDETESLSAENHQRLAIATEHAESVIEIAEKARYIQQTTGDTTVEPQQLGPLIRSAAEEVTAEYSAADIQFSGADGVTVLADANLDVAVREALENGIIHQETDSPTVVVSVSTPNEDMAQIEIQNEGSIPDLERYTLEKGEETPLEHSSGLGLWLIKWVVENAHGSIEFPDPDSGEARLQIELYRVPS
ncbi:MULTISPECIES: MEDS domain-containing protein [Halobacterium]|uniref:MEDS domain-containing protein n=1 Tax=Halobacterium TaxID=2239 RepID=UPI00073F16C2|nr:MULTISPECIES: MEDS domain-containing protein [Halobacterium]MCG1001902.1 MEDS domain-containing protein [Halobacterium noricense]